LGGNRIAIGRLFPSPQFAKSAELDKPVSVGRTSHLLPVRVWLDTSGKPIQVHGGIDPQSGWSILLVMVKNKEFTTGENRMSGPWGVRLLSIEDFYNWDDLGLIIPARFN